MSLGPVVSTPTQHQSQLNLVSHELNQNLRRTPRWLLEFNLVKTPTINQLPNSNRPLTSVSSLHPPKWFEELTQSKRRMSDVSENFNSSDTGESSPNHPRFSLDFDSLRKFPRSNEKPNETKLLDVLDENPFRLIDFTPENSLKTINFNGSKSSSIDENLLDLDDNLISFSSTFKSIESLKLDETVKTNEEECIIPEMPKGKKLTFILLENWGDQHWIGLNGIEILDEFGNRPRIKDIFFENQNQLQDGNDLYKLIDNVYRTHDDNHIWQCRFDNQTLPISLKFQFEKPITIALIRIWNHNKSRIHSYRGVKFAKIKLDDQTIFLGEIAKASGNLIGSLENFGDTILFTTDDAVLERISHFDVSFQELLLEQTH